MQSSIIAQCLYTITEDNPISGQQLYRSQDHLKIIDSILCLKGNDPHYFLLKVLIAGLLSRDIFADFVTY